MEVVEGIAFTRSYNNMGQFLQDGNFFLVYVTFFSISKFDFEILNKKNSKRILKIPSRAADDERFWLF